MVSMDKVTNRIVLSGLVVLLSACGGGGSGSDDGNTGVFTDGPVQGLRYSSADFSGLTNENGEFQYTPGQTITFSLGGTTLGSVEAAAEISTFDLFESSPPSTEQEIRELLSEGEGGDIRRSSVAEKSDSDSSDGQRIAGRPETAQREDLTASNDLQKVVNIARLLITFDNDRIASNGLDLSGWDERLAEEALDINMAPGYFS